jgi:hypothetical protein
MSISGQQKIGGIIGIEVGNSTTHLGSRKNMWAMRTSFMSNFGMRTGKKSFTEITILISRKYLMQTLTVLS